VATTKRVEVSVGEHRLSLSNLEKLMYPRAGFTKGHVIDYYMRVAPVLLPHLEGRPLTLKRYPNGVEGGHFYEKRCPDHRPDWVRTAGVWSGRNEGEVNYCVCDDLATLVWLANLADLELHTPLHTVPDVQRPRVIAFDLDPGPPATIVECARVALQLRAAFDHFGLQAFPKTSGSKGMQVYVPLNTPGVTYEDTRAFSLGVATVLERRSPELVVTDMKKHLRRHKVLVDWSQNERHKTTVCVYSLRAMERPTASTPLHWHEVEAVAESGDPEALVFTSSDVLERVAEHGDLFAPVLELQQALPR
jgi:bifunctional non-homologous end joining protein LigD